MYFSKRYLSWVGVVVATLLDLSCASSAQTIQLHVDLTDAPRNIYHAKLHIPVRPGDMSLVFPKWIPGNHRPSGPIGGLTGIQMEAGGHPILWQRDPVEMYEFHVTVPAGVDSLDVSLDAITTEDSAGGGGPAASDNILDLNWNAVVLYPKGVRSDDVTFVPSLTLPPGWKFGTALEVARESGSDVEFSPVPLTMLVDSPLIAGVHFRKIELTKAGESPAHDMDLVADSEAALAMSPKDLASTRNWSRKPELCLVHVTTVTTISSTRLAARLADTALSIMNRTTASLPSARCSIQIWVCCKPAFYRTSSFIPGTGSIVVQRGSRLPTIRNR